MRTVLFTGSRGWQDIGSITDAIDSIGKPFRGIVGDTDGFDTLVLRVLRKRGVPYLKFNAHWKSKGRSAGHQRNDLMLAWLTMCEPSFVVAGWDGMSPGTKSCMDKASSQGFDVWKIQYIPALNGG